MKKFSKITESKEYLGWSSDKIKHDFKLLLNPISINITELFVYKDGDQSGSLVAQTEDFDKGFPRCEEFIYAPMFFIELSLGEIPGYREDHEINGEQVDNWSSESIRFDIVKDIFVKLSDVLETYKDDFYVSIEMGGSNKIFSYDKETKEHCLLKITISLTMKDYIDYYAITGEPYPIKKS